MKLLLSTLCWLTLAAALPQRNVHFVPSGAFPGPRENAPGPQVTPQSPEAVARQREAMRSLLTAVSQRIMLERRAFQQRQDFAPRGFLPPGQQVPQGGFFLAPQAPSGPQTLTPGDPQKFFLAAAPQNKPQTLNNDDLQKYFLAAPSPNKPKAFSPEDPQKYYFTTSNNPETLSPEDPQKFYLAASNDPKTLDPEDPQKYYLEAPAPKAPEQPGKQKKGAKSEGKSVVGITEEEFDQFVAAAKSPSGKPGKGGKVVKRGGYQHYEAPIQEHYYEHQHVHESYPSKVLHYDEEDRRTRHAVLDALWRAVQALTGGALAVGGHLAKGGGLLLQAKGRLLAQAGPAVSEFGRSVATESLNHHHGVQHYPHHDDHYPGHYKSYRRPHEARSSELDPHEFLHAAHSDYDLFDSAHQLSSSLKVAAVGTTRALADLVHELTHSAARAYLLKN